MTLTMIMTLAIKQLTIRVDMKMSMEPSMQPHTTVKVERVDIQKDQVSSKLFSKKYFLIMRKILKKVFEASPKVQPIKQTQQLPTKSQQLNKRHTSPKTTSPILRFKHQQLQRLLYKASKCFSPKSSRKIWMLISHSKMNSNSSDKRKDRLKQHSK